MRPRAKDPTEAVLFDPAHVGKRDLVHLIVVSQMCLWSSSTTAAEDDPSQSHPSFAL
jgi:hypothetical protein